MNSVIAGTVGVISGILGLINPPVSAPTTNSNTVAPGNNGTISAGVYKGVPATVLQVDYAADGVTPVHVQLQLAGPYATPIHCFGPSINIMVSS